MKIVVSKVFLAQLPPVVRSVVVDWTTRERRRHISVEHVTRFSIAEDARYTAFSADLQAQKSMRASGEWAGLTDLVPGGSCPLPAGCTVIETQIFLGKAFLTIFHNPAASEAADAALPSSASGGAPCLAVSPVEPPQLERS